MPKRVLMTVERDVSETGHELEHYEAGDVAVLSDKTTQVLVRANECKVLGSLPDDYDPSRTKREPGRLAAKQATYEDKSAAPESTKKFKKKSRSRKD